MSNGIKITPVANLNSQAENREYLWRFQNFRFDGDKFAAVTSDLRRGKSSLAYRPAALALMSLCNMCRLTAQAGAPWFINAKKFTRDGKLITDIAGIKAGMVASCGDVSDSTIKQALSVLHVEGLLYKTHGFYGWPGQSRRGHLFVDMKGYALFTKLQAVVNRVDPMDELTTVSFPLSGPGEYGFDCEKYKGADLLPNINSSICPNSQSIIKTTSSMPGNILIMNPGQLFRNHRTGAASAAFFKNPEEGTAARVKFRLTFQMRRILEFLRTHAIFMDTPESAYAVKARITAQEASVLIRAVERSGLTLSFLRAYCRALERHPDSGWYLKLSLGEFCEKFYQVRKAFYTQTNQDEFEGSFIPDAETLTTTYLTDAEAAKADAHKLQQVEALYVNDKVRAIHQRGLLQKTAIADAIAEEERNT